MAHAEFQAGYNLPEGGIIKLVMKGTAAMVASVESGYRSAQRRKTLAGLSLDQLNDIGYPAAEVRPRPVIEVPAGLVTNLMSMR